MLIAHVNNVRESVRQLGYHVYVTVFDFVIAADQVIESYASKVLPEKGPMVDCEYWQACETGLTMLVEQLKMPVMKRIPALLEQARSPIAPSFQYYYTELWKQYVEARDSNKFMQTLLRYFKVRKY